MKKIRKTILRSFLDMEGSGCLIDYDLATDLAWYVFHGLDKYLLYQRPSLIGNLSESFLGQIHRDRARALFLWSELDRLLEEAAEVGLHLVPLKGLVIAERVWGGFINRPLEDIDLYCPANQVEEATTFLVKNGYQEHLSLASSQRSLHRRVEHEAQFSHCTTQHLVELHWNLSYGFRSIPWRLEEHPSLKRWLLAPEDELLFLILHGTKHRWSRVKWILDIAFFCKEIHIDWRTFQKRVSVIRAERPVGIIFLLLAELFDTEWNLYEEVLSPTLRYQVASLAHSLLTSITSIPQSLRDQFYYQVGLRASWQEKCSYIIDLLFTPKVADLESFHLPRRLQYLYYLLRPHRLLKQYGVTFLRDRQ